MEHEVTDTLRNMMRERRRQRELVGPPSSPTMSRRSALAGLGLGLGLAALAPAAAPETALAQSVTTGVYPSSKIHQAAWYKYETRAYCNTRSHTSQWTSNTGVAMYCIQPRVSGSYAGDQGTSYSLMDSKLDIWGESGCMYGSTKLRRACAYIAANYAFKPVTYEGTTDDGRVVAQLAIWGLNRYFYEGKMSSAGENGWNMLNCVIRSWWGSNSSTYYGNVPSESVYGRSYTVIDAYNLACDAWDNHRADTSHDNDVFAFFPSNGSQALLYYNNTGKLYKHSYETCTESGLGSGEYRVYTRLAAGTVSDLDHAYGTISEGTWTMMLSGEEPPCGQIQTGLNRHWTVVTDGDVAKLHPGSNMAYDLGFHMSGTRPAALQSAQDHAFHKCRPVYAGTDDVAGLHIKGYYLMSTENSSYCLTAPATQQAVGSSATPTVEPYTGAANQVFYFEHLGPDGASCEAEVESWGTDAPTITDAMRKQCRYTVYTDAACTNALMTVGNDEGIDAVKNTTYYIKETESPEQLAKSEQTYVANFTSSDTNGHLSFVDMPRRANIDVYKTVSAAGPVIPDGTYHIRCMGARYLTAKGSSQGALARCRSTKVAWSVHNLKADGSKVRLSPSLSATTLLTVDHATYTDGTKALLWANNDAHDTVADNSYWKISASTTSTNAFVISPVAATGMCLQGDTDAVTIQTRTSTNKQRWVFEPVGADELLTSAEVSSEQADPVQRIWTAGRIGEDTWTEWCADGQVVGAPYVLRDGSYDQAAVDPLQALVCFVDWKCGVLSTLEQTYADGNSVTLTGLRLDPSDLHSYPPANVMPASSTPKASLMSITLRFVGSVMLLCRAHLVGPGKGRAFSDVTYDKSVGWTKWAASASNTVAQVGSSNPDYVIDGVQFALYAADGSLGEMPSDDSYSLGFAYGDPATA